MGIINHLIEVKYQNAQNCSRDLETIATIVKNLADNDIADILNTTNAAWDGDSSVICCQKINGLKNSVKGTGISLSNASRATKIISDNVHRAEMRTLEIIYSRKY